MTQPAFMGMKVGWSKQDIQRLKSLVWSKQDIQRFKDLFGYNRLKPEMLNYVHHFLTSWART